MRAEVARAAGREWVVAAALVDVEQAASRAMVAASAVARVVATWKVAETLEVAAWVMAEEVTAGR